MNVKWIGSPNHYQGRNGYQVTHITLHIMAGYLAGTDSVFLNAASQASAHYGIGSTGEIHQYVSETDGSWSDANYDSDNSTISIEHEGGIASAPCTDACVEASARLCADIARRYGWTHLWHDGLKGNVWMHREIPGTDHAGCPDQATNGLPVQQVLDKANELLKGEDMPTSQEIAEAVWNFEQNGVKCRDRLQGVDQQCQAMPEKVWSFSIKNVQARDRLYGLDALQMPQLAATVAAQQAAIDTLAKSVGADPTTIANAVEQAVKNKLESLIITVGKPNERQQQRAAARGNHRRRRLQAGVQRQSAHRRLHRRSGLRDRRHRLHRLWQSRSRRLGNHRRRTHRRRLRSCL